MVCQPGLSNLVMDEMRSWQLRHLMGIEKVTGGILFQGHDKALFDACLRSRTGSRVLVQLGEFRATSDGQFKSKLLSLAPWSEFLREGDTKLKFVVSSGISSRLFHTGRVEGLARTILDRFCNEESTNLQEIIVTVIRDNVRVSINASGEHLHRRFYRQQEKGAVRMPLRENVAAALLLHFGFYREPLQDPFCGSGTIPIEAALIATRTAPGLVRMKNSAIPFAFLEWPSVNLKRFYEVVDSLKALQDFTRAPMIKASDRSTQTIFKNCVERAGVTNLIDFESCTFNEISRLQTKSPVSIVTNPPFGKRSGGSKELRGLYISLGKWFKTTFRENDRLGILSPETTEAAKNIGLMRLSWGKNDLSFLSGGTQMRFRSSTIKGQS